GPYALSIAAGNSLTQSINLTGASGGGINLPVGGTTSASLNGVNLGGVNRTINVANGSVDDDLLISGLVSNGAITKTGPGTLTLTATNTYAGGNFINGRAVAIISN